MIASNRTSTYCPHNGAICIDAYCLINPCKAVFNRDLFCAEAEIRNLKARISELEGEGDD